MAMVTGSLGGHAAKFICYAPARTF